MIWILSIWIWILHIWIWIEKGKNKSRIERKTKKKSFFYCNYIPFSFFFRFYSSFFWEKKKGTYKIKIKDYFVSNSHLFNRWIGAYSGSESWGVLLDHFYQLKAPIHILCILCRNILLHNLHYKSFVYLGVSNHPLVFVQSFVCVKVIHVW